MDETRLGVNEDDDDGGTQTGPSPSQTLFFVPQVSNEMFELFIAPMNSRLHLNVTCRMVEECEGHTWVCDDPSWP